MKIFGIEIERDVLLKKIGDISQLGGIKLFELTDGLGRGVRAADIISPCGINMMVVLDRGMDISNLSYKSIPINWHSATRITSPFYYSSRGIEWLRTFFGGLLTTCGLTYMGPPNIDNNEELGLHGRISNISAESINTNCRWEEDDYILEICGRIREVRVLGEKLELQRKITTFFSKPRIIIEDFVENIGFDRSPLMVLYHINIGFPILDKKTKLIESEAKITPRDENAKKELNNYNSFIEPVKSFKEQVYYHDIKEDINGDSNIALINKDFNNKEGIGISLKFNKNNLPYLIEWKQMGEGEYVCGIEPSNTFVSGRSNERKNGTLKFIEPGETIKYKLEFNILPNNEEIRKYSDFIGYK